ncbi:dihydrofolate reductase [Microbacterium sp. 18062]|uniref:dihydrofolate reductase n=1 Tax=Microbacterium sp. 18062 TaxID=2681410 RepID=UPI00135674CF|nr:dihydrofolate reductase [Microbacterium sp. 18062]
MSGVGLIWAQARDRVIGAGGGMPWHVPEDLAHFKAVTSGHPVVMGRRTWESFPERFRPLPDRRNIVVTRTPGWSAPGAEPAASLDEALEAAGAGRIWVIGGGRLYAEAIERADLLEVTDLDLEVEGDTHAPALDGWAPVVLDPAGGWHTSRSGIRYRFTTYRRTAG